MESRFVMDYNEKEILEQLFNPQTQRQAFSKLVEKYSKQLYWNIRHIVLDHEDANDILQNTFVKAWSNLESFQHKSKLSTWLYRIAINESLDFVRHQRVVNSTSTDDNEGVTNKLLADEYFDGTDLQAQLQEVVSTLPDIQRTVFTMRYYEEMRYKDMSDILNTSEGALKASYHIAVKKITEHFKDKD